MAISRNPSYTFGLARIKQEGAPAHPEDIYIHDPRFSRAFVVVKNVRNAGKNN